MSRDHDYRGLLIRGAVIKGSPKAAVLAGARRLHVANGEDLDSAIAAARGWVDALFAEEAARRRAPHVATVEEYVRYFAQHPPAEHALAMLRAHATAPEGVMTATELAEAAGWPSYTSANVHYGNLGRDVAQTLHLTLPPIGENGSPVWTMALADDAGLRDEAGRWRWRMHPELVEALKALAIVQGAR